MGCGDGRVTGFLTGLCPSVCALDPESESVARAADRHGDNAVFLVGSGENLPLGENLFDTVVFSLSLHHQEPSRALAEARRVIRAGGRILVLEPNPGSLYNRLFRLVHNEDEKYARAEAAVTGCGLPIEDSGTVAYRWIFEDFAEMSCHIFSYVGTPPDRAGTRAMEKILEKARDARPLSVEDVTNFWVLR
ncbi:MAG: class I SAM-dependent methyltransferase [Proteobacteria bacterium]|nr:class I SAM-dependent methyltransferase [Pseudomonadota bacterium]